MDFVTPQSTDGSSVLVFHVSVLHLCLVQGYRGEKDSLTVRIRDYIRSNLVVCFVDDPHPVTYFRDPRVFSSYLN